METSWYKTKDLWEAGALVVIGSKLINVERTGSVCYFIFEDNEYLRGIINKYYFGSLLVDAYKYQEAVGRLKRQIFN